MTKKILSVYLLLHTIIFLNAQNDFALISSRILEQILTEINTEEIDNTVNVFLPELTTDGQWQDIDYKNRDITKWGPIAHLNRVKHLALSYTQKGSSSYQHASVNDAIINALRFWYLKDPTSSNWWHNEIAAPQTIGQILIIMQKGRKLLPEGLRDSLLLRMNRGNVFKQAGANKLDIAMHMIYRACVSQNPSLMDTAVQQVFQPIVFTTSEGLQYDYSYLQHGRQLQISSYGLVFLMGEFKVASWVRNTAYQLKGDKLQLLSNYLVNTYLPAIRGKYIDFNTEGRAVSRPDVLDKQKSLENGIAIQLIEMAKKVIPDQTKILDAALLRILQKEPPSYKISSHHNHFWKADYTQHIRKEYTINLRTVSDRTLRTESGNGENLLGKFLPDGSTNIQRTGGEYVNIMPLWEWDKIPGITSRDYQEDQPVLVKWGERGTTDFVGGVSDSIYGVSAYHMKYSELTAKKSWFFFDKEVVCLGAGIKSESPENIVTTVNQCWMNGNVWAGKECKVSEQFSGKVQGMNWVWHDSIGYYFLSDQLVVCDDQIQKGSWYAINNSYSKDEVSGRVFKLYVDHGIRPASASYAYAVVPQIGVDSAKAYDRSLINILNNTDTLQAVWHSKLKMLQAVFYKPGLLKTEKMLISADQACILLLKQSGKEQYAISVADPTQKLQSVNLNIQMNGVNKIIPCVLPQGNLAGSSVLIQPF